MNKKIKDNLKVIEKNIISLQDVKFEKLIISASKIIIDSLKKNKKFYFLVMDVRLETLNICQ